MRYLYSFFVVLIFWTCQKNDSPDPSQPPTNIKLGKLYFGFNGTLTCVDITTMTKAWEQPNVFAYSNVPLYDSGVVFTCNMYGATALDAVTGAIKWKTPYSSEAYVNNGLNYSCSPLIVDSLFYCLGFTGSYGFANAYCLNKRTGSMVWQSRISSGAAPLVKNLSTPIAFGDKLILAGASWDGINKLMCYNRFTGQVLWQTDVFQMQINPSNYPRTDGTTIFVDDVKSGQVHGFDISTGQKKWTSSLPTGPQVTDRMYLWGNYIIAISEFDAPSHPSYIYKIDKNAGSLTGTISLPKYVVSIIVKDNDVYASSATITYKYDLNSLSKKWEATHPSKAKIDSQVAANNIQFSDLGEIITTDQYSLNYYRLFLYTSPYCESEFTLIDNNTGKILKTYSNKCEIMLPEKYLFVVDKKAYYPSQGGM